MLSGNSAISRRETRIEMNMNRKVNNNNQKHSKITNTIPLNVNHSETTPQSNPSYPRPTQNKQIYYPTFMFKQNRRRKTSITTMSPLQNRINTHYKVMDLWTDPVELGVCWLNGRGKPFSQCAWMLAEWGCHQSACLERDVGDLHHYR